MAATEATHAAARGELAATVAEARRRIAAINSADDVPAAAEGCAAAGSCCSYARHASRSERLKKAIKIISYFYIILIKMIEVFILFVQK